MSCLKTLVACQRDGGSNLETCPRELLYWVRGNIHIWEPPTWQTYQQQATTIYVLVSRGTALQLMVVKTNVKGVCAKASIKWAIGTAFKVNHMLDRNNI